MEKEKSKLFRAKSIETIESPESLTDYLKVTSPKVWLVLAAIMLILIGMMVWSVAGRIDTSVRVAVIYNDDGGVCYIPAAGIESALRQNMITVDGQPLLLSFDQIQPTVISDETDIRVRLYGGFNYGDIVYCAKIDSPMTIGSYTGMLKTESIQPITLLFN